MIRQRAFDIALACRYACEEVAQQIAQERAYINPDGLGGMCAIASEYLFNRLNNEGIPNKFIKSIDGDTHCWNYCDNTILDITATQFGYHLPPVYVHATADPLDHKVVYVRRARHANQFDICVYSWQIAKCLNGWTDKLDFDLENKLDLAYRQFL